MSSNQITSLFLDIGGVLLSNGWDRTMRRKAAEKFGLDYDDMDERHHLTFDTYEEGKLGIEEYLNRVVFYRQRDFSRQDFEEFMYAQSQPIPEMIELVRNLKARYALKLVAVSNEGRELTLHRVRKFRLNDWIDVFISSCFVHFRKPDADMYRLALDCAQVAPEQAIYIDDREMFVEVAETLGIRGIHHSNWRKTRSALAEFGLEAD